VRKNADTFAAIRKELEEGVVKSRDFDGANVKQALCGEGFGVSPAPTRLTVKECFPTVNA
jgi:hypothetical protein